ncbi:hypothetical protein [Bacillus suaedaesalsae]|uniref:Lipoprotein n=1 Tax=Bacillus suaedaesalsae TaxID=2810349 RepID=A0ABS2DLV5_9BACI|nr:hypothetical protein [Bacillus suaedaesalsae]MBM6619472.1 hypothetical protein [Bacillus suaedaesalsae]
MLKKLIAAGIISSALLLAACSADKETTEEPKAEETEKETEKVEVDTRTELVNFHISLIDNFKDEYQTYSAYGAAIAAKDAAVASQSDAEVAEEDKPTAEDIAELEAAIAEAKANAQGIADASADEIRNYEIPAELETYSADIKAALEDLAKFYEGVKADVDNTEANEALFTSFGEKMGALFEKEELPAPNYANAMS